MNLHANTMELRSAKVIFLYLFWAGEMARQTRVLGVKPGYLSAISGTYIEERTIDSHKLSPDLHTAAVTLT